MDYNTSWTTEPPNWSNNSNSTPSATFQSLYFVFVIIFNGYIGITIYSIGIFGNIMSCVIFIKRRKHDRISAQYLGVLAVSDLCLLVFIAIPSWVRSDFNKLQDYVHWNSQMPNDLMCKFLVYFWNAITMFSSWILVVFCFERTLVTWMPLKMGPIFAEAKIRRIVLVVVFSFSFLFPLGHFRWIVLRIASGGFYHCLQREDLPIWEINFGNFICFAVPMAMPLVLLTILNLLLIVGVRRNRIAMEKCSRSIREINMIRNLLTVSLVYFILITPTVILNYYYDNVGLKGYSPEGKQIFFMIYSSGRILACFNSAVNPWIYTFSLGFYRKTLFELMCPCYQKLVHNSESRSSQSSFVFYGRKFSEVSIRNISENVE